MFRDGKLINALQGKDYRRAFELLRGLLHIVEKTFPKLSNILTGLGLGGLEANKLLGPGVPVS